MNREKIGRLLLVSGLVSWISLMTIIVINNLRTQEKPTLVFSLVTLGCWVVFFIGKSLLKTRESHAPDA
jgi:nitric oxide reductase large subunit